MTRSEKIKKGLNKIVSNIHMDTWHYNQDLNFGEVTLEAMKDIRAHLDLMIQKKERQLGEIGLTPSEHA